MENNEVTRTVPETEAQQLASLSTKELAALSVEFNQAKADGFLARIGELCAMSKSAYTNPQHNPSYVDIAKELSDLVEKHNHYSEMAKLCQIVGAEDSMLEAVKILEYTRVSVQEKTSDIGGGILRWQEYKTTQKRLDLTKCATFCRQNKVAFGKDPDWFYTIEKLCCVLTLGYAKELGIPADQIAKIDGSFNMSKVARDVQLAAEDPEHPNPLSKTQISKNLTLILSQMVGDAYHADTRDSAFLKGCFAGMGRASLSMKTANSKRLCDIIFQIAHRSVFDKSYTIQAATKKERS